MVHTYKKESLQSWSILAVILIIGISLRLYHLDSYSIFFDEKSTMVVSQGIVLEGANQKETFSTRKLTAPEFWKTPEFSFKSPQVLRSFTYKETFYPRSFTPADFWSAKTLGDYYEAMTRSDIGNSPFYYLLLHIWMDIFGLSDFSARLFSVVFSVLIIGFTYQFGRRFFSVNTGLISAGIVAIEPFFIAYSHQARNYSLTFFLTLLSTYLFLQIIEGKKNSFWLYAGYVLAAGLGLLCHFLTIVVLLVHGLYAIFFLRSISGWVKMAVSAVAALSGVTWWLIYGGGQYTFYSLNYQADLYKRMAETRPYDNPFGVLPATFANVFNKALPVFSDLLIFTNGMSDSLVGKRNAMISILVGILLIVWYRYKDKIKVHEFFAPRIPYIIVLVSALVYTSNKFQFCVLSVVIFALSFLYDVHKNADKLQRKRLTLLYMMALIPTLFLVLMAFKSGHTNGITQRYSGFSFPYVIILVSILLQYYSNLATEFRLLIFFFLAVQFYFVGQRLQEFYQDRSVKYGYFATPRVKNPYYEAAEKIKQIYLPGDTILYPAYKLPILSEMDRTFLPYSVQDAQLTNLYLPKSLNYIQVMDTTQVDRILIKRNNQKEPLEIINLRGKRYGSE
ncbi:Dolichyl-phosphate-mannose-protein mannosyltransferase [Dyadobacter koreensis]|uniref:Dolichyl-phosphate-mannose-protein mannosyltransferase n=1 Tax=Dyadobacter koreensis TaxID=408657 RepID=A0A1H6SFU0_9BACT|nr:glycosyltransferase family 39 protein [Dyadobacter koreensis]SEI62920.1 Dolichyl-phosphate-mannose-protein mannosyltransferase [Dyadobacter koreensis]